ncbi:MAG: SprT family zinc-dependent metalloprotease [Pseudomonadota bacterium]
MPRTTSEVHILPGDPPIEVLLRRSARARRFSLRVSRTDGGVSLSLPVWADQSEAIAFLHTREAWLRGHVARAPGRRRPVMGGTLPIGGTDRPILAGPGRAARFDGAAIRVPDDDRMAARIRVLLRALARDRLSEAVMRHSDRLGRRAGRVTLRDPRSRWGSCSARGDLMFSWRLIMAPSEVLDYVAAHEVAHLVEMNHSDRFWALCAELCPEMATHRAWLRRDGPELLAWDFNTAPL